jgi:beta-phosphoglucomutase-like phosphatase (HAD superfamily)
MIATEAETATLQLPARDFAGYIFDCDGTLVDSMPIHYVCWVEALRNNGATYEFTEEEFYYYAGVPEKDTVIILNAKHNVFIDPEAVVSSKAAQFLKRIGELKVVRPVADYARSLHGERPMSVASGSEAPVVRACLQATGLFDLFPHVITPENVKRGKPAPDMFLLAAERMGIKPQDCLVFEDGRSGVEAAKAAGMEVVFIPRTLR